MKLLDRILKNEDLFWNRISNDVPVIFWGCGNTSSIVKELLGKKGILPTAYCDSNLDLVGEEINGVPVLSYEQVKYQYDKYCLVLAVAINHAKEIIEELRTNNECNPAFHVEKPFKVDNELLEYSYLENYLDKFERVYELLEDELSKQIFVENINYKLSGNKINLLQYKDGNSFFDETLIPESEKYNYIDIGAYTGDTLLQFYAFCRGKYSSIHVVEPDEENLNSLKKLVQYGRLNNICFHNVGGWNCKDKLEFYTVENNRDNFESPNFFKPLKKMRGSWGIAEDRCIVQKVDVDTVDNILQDASCDIIKINALAADWETLQGCRKTIQTKRPIIIGEYGTRKECLTEMLGFINDIDKDYKFYLRQKQIFDDCKTIFYAIPIVK